MGEMLGVVLVKSAIGEKPKTRGTLRALGLRKIDQRRVHRDGPVLRGMLARVAHLVEVEPAEYEGVAE
ncbi:MAG: 50S ribosomal protein L30 [Acidimicrobiia bacterium]